jgi:hypothetical protein
MIDENAFEQNEGRNAELSALLKRVEIHHLQNFSNGYKNEKTCHTFCGFGSSRV